MALSYKTIPYNDIEFINRLDSKYYQLRDTIQEYEIKNQKNVLRLGDVIDNITDGEHAGQVFVKKGILFLKNSSIKDFDISTNDGFYITEEKHKMLSRSALHPRDVLFTTIGHLGSAAIVPENFCEANMNQNFVKMKINEEQISPYYVTCFLNSKVARREINSLLTGNIQSILTYPKIKSIKILRPDDRNIEKEIEEKYKTALEYSHIAREKISNVIKELELKLGLDDNDNKTNIYSINPEQLFNDCDLWTPKYFYPLYINTENELINNFETCSLGQIADMKKGDEPGSDYYIDYLEKNDTDVPFVRTSDLYNYQIDSSPDNFIDKNSYVELDQDIKTGDILYTKDGKIGEIALITEADKVIISSGVEKIRLNKKGYQKGLTPEYLFAIMCCEKIGKYTADRYTVTASTIPHLKEDFIKKMVVPILDSESINIITEKIKEAFSLLNKKKELVLECQNQINSIIKN